MALARSFHYVERADDFSRRRFLFGDTSMANKDQNKGKSKGNAPKLTAKQKKEKKVAKAAAKAAKQ
jgi:hypothetical protein